MNPTAMLLLIVAAHAVFFWSAIRRWQLLRLGRFVDRFDRIPERIAAVFRYAFAQEKMSYYQPAGWAHKLIFVGFLVLLLRTLVLWGRGFDPTLNLFVLGPTQPARQGLRVREGHRRAARRRAASSVFVYYRVDQPAEAHDASGEGLLILGIIVTMMLADILYDGASLVARRQARRALRAATATTSSALCRRMATIIAPLGGPAEVHAEFSPFPSPAGSAMAHRSSKRSFSAGALVIARARRLLDALDAGADLPEHPAALEALPHHHGDPERLPQGPRRRAAASGRWPRTPRS